MASEATQQGEEEAKPGDDAKNHAGGEDNAVVAMERDIGNGIQQGHGSRPGKKQGWVEGRNTDANEKLPSPIRW